MTEPNNSKAPSSSDLVDKVRYQAKHLAGFGQQVLNHLSKGTVSRVDEPQSVTSDQRTIDMKAGAQAGTGERQGPHQLFRQQLPGLTEQLLGKRFHQVSRIAGMVAPQGSFDKAADQILELLADFSSTIGDSYQVLDEAGVSTLADLQHDTARSGRLARALGEQNRLIGMAQGALSGVLGIFGAVADLPLSTVIALRTIYLTGHAYGFDLDQPEDRALVFDALSRVDLSLMAEKQAIFLGLRTLGKMMDTGDWQHLQQLLGSNNNIEPLRKFLSDDNGQLKWKLSPAVISKIAPLVGGAAGAIYNARFIQEVGEQARAVFEEARQQLLTPPPTQNDSVQSAAQHAVDNNQTIEKVTVQARTDNHTQAISDEAQDNVIHQQLDSLADQVVVAKEPTKPPAKPPVARARKKPASASSKSSASGSTVAPSERAPVKTPRRRVSKASTVAPTDKVATEKAAASTTPAAPRRRSPAKKTTTAAAPKPRAAAPKKPTATAKTPKPDTNEE